MVQASPTKSRKTRDARPHVAACPAPVGRLCVVCKVQADVVVQRAGLCMKHRRFRQMINSAKFYDKAVPTMAQLEAAFDGLDGFRCPDCSRPMHWLKYDGEPATVCTLQHYRDGTFGLVCGSCNTRHAFMPGDSFRELPDGHKLCRACNAIKPLAEFYREKRGFIKASAYCRPCHIAKVIAREKRWKNAERRARGGQIRRSA